jgi:tetratricopeptide (TPR) repeat protein
MRKVLVTIVLALITAAMAQGQSSEQKTIKDPAEYNAYIAALNMTDPAAKAAAMEAFVKQYPQSIVKADALDQAMAGYQASNNLGKVEEIANQILQLNQNHIRALAVMTAISRSKATGGDAAAAKIASADCQRGLQALPSWSKEPGMSDADFDKMRNQMSWIFNGACGFSALQAKDYPSAQKFFKESLRIDPTNMQDTYQLSVAQLETNPIDLQGLWYGAKAIQLAGSNTAARDGISNYIKAKYKKYHGKVDDYNQFLAAVAAQNAPPADMATMITPAPTPCDIAVDAVKQNDPGQLSFSDWEFVLSKANCSPANKAAAEKVWQAILAKQKNGEADVKLKLPAILVISATNDTLQLAITDENQQAKKADLTVVLEKPAVHPPAPGSNVDVVGVLTAYTADPFMFTMEKGELPGAPPAKPPVRHPPARRKPAR